MLGDMPSVRAAAEKPPLSTTFTKVAMLVMRSMSYATIQLGEDMFRRSVLIKLPAITFAHICGRLERGCGPADATLGNLLVFSRPPLVGPEPSLRHARQARREGCLSRLAIAHAGPSHALDHD